MRGMGKKSRAPQARPGRVAQDPPTLSTETECLGMMQEPPGTDPGFAG